VCPVVGFRDHGMASPSALWSKSSFNANSCRLLKVRSPGLLIARVTRAADSKASRSP
jgi:hypothetical protein